MNIFFKPQQIGLIIKMITVKAPEISLQAALTFGLIVFSTSAITVQTYSKEASAPDSPTLGSAEEQIVLFIEQRSPDLTKILWLDHKARDSYTIWTNLSLSHMPSFGSFNYNDRLYHYRALIDARALKTDPMGSFPRHPKLPPVAEQDRPPAPLSGKYFEYLLDLPAMASAPAELYRDMDVFLAESMKQLPHSRRKMAMMSAGVEAHPVTERQESMSVETTAAYTTDTFFTEADTYEATTLSASSIHPVHEFFGGIQIDDTTWHYSNWFGYYSFDAAGDWIFHNTFGWLTVDSITDGSASGGWVFSPQLKNLWIFKPSNPSTADGFSLSFHNMPPGFQHAFYLNDNNQARFFYLWDQGYWITIPDKDPATQPDLDQDGLGDWTEMDYFSNLYRDANSDFDSDGMSDWWEMENFNTLSRDGNGDFDNDGILDRFEWQAGTDPTVDGAAQTAQRDDFSYDDRGWLSAYQLMGSTTAIQAHDADGNIIQQN